MSKPLTAYKEGKIITKHGVFEITTIHKDGIFANFDLDTLTKYGRYLHREWSGNIFSGKNNFWAFPFKTLGITKQEAWENLNYSLERMLREFNSESKESVFFKP